MKQGHALETWTKMLILVCGLGWTTQLLAEDQPPVALIKRTSSEMIAAIDAERAVLEKDSARLYQLVDKIVLPHFDFERMARLVLGKHWRQASATQRSQFTEEFRLLLVRTYAKAMLEYSGQEIIYLPLRMMPGQTEVVVKTEINQQGGLPIPIDYSLYFNDGKWQVFTVSIDDVNLVINYRTSFASEINNPGGLDGLISKLHKRNQEESNGG